MQFQHTHIPIVCWPPLSAIDNLQPFCCVYRIYLLKVMHGGLFSKDDVTLEDIRKVDRFRQPSDEGM